MKYFLTILGSLWILPVTILVWTFYVIPLIITGNIKFYGWANFLVPRFDLIPKNNKYSKMWENWAGCALPNCVILKYSDITGRLKKHELRHIYQQWVFGVFFYLIYAAHYICLEISGFNGYYYNVFEVDARKASKL